MTGYRSALTVQTTAREAKTGFREALHRRVAERVAGMPEEDAAAWITGHGLLSMASCDALPAGVRERLRDRVRRTTAYNLFAVARFQEAVDALAGIPVCPLKGIHLLDTVYRDDPGSRPLADVDLLVPAGAVDEAVARLEEALGLAESPTSRRLRKVHPERVLAGQAFVLELHERLGYVHGWASTWDDLAPAPARVHGRAVHVLDRETTLVHLVTHLVKHRPLSRLVWVEDVARWAVRGVDGARAIEISRRIGAGRAFAAGVRAVRGLVGASFLPGVAEPGGRPRGCLSPALERWLWPDLSSGRLPDPSSELTGGAVAAGKALSALALADRPGLALRYLRIKGAELLLRPRRPDLR